ncbi:hypothetical protein EDD68_10814 [Melghiribacillus thermohalophilus]|uniref:Uncharacterized protein n=1 Tax=Melghiribacillus thermohalophilus TaxID=1324956 RepID=A0A4R3N199_9BACI|nr:hypothetical protein EDD68_10814 [Melghiribacillus thermohalophilus]
MKFFSFKKENGNMSSFISALYVNPNDGKVYSYEK